MEWTKKRPDNNGLYWQWDENNPSTSMCLHRHNPRMTYPDGVWFMGPIGYPEPPEPPDIQARQNRAAIKELEALLSYIKQCRVDVRMIKHGIGEVEVTAPGDIVRKFAPSGRGDSLTITWDLK